MSRCTDRRNQAGVGFKKTEKGLGQVVTGRGDNDCIECLLSWPSGCSVTVLQRDIVNAQRFQVCPRFL